MLIGSKLSKRYQATISLPTIRNNMTLAMWETKAAKPGWRQEVGADQAELNFTVTGKHTEARMNAGNTLPNGKQQQMQHPGGTSSSDVVW